MYNCSENLSPTFMYIDATIFLFRAHNVHFGIVFRQVRAYACTLYCCMTSFSCLIIQGGSVKSVLLYFVFTFVYFFL